MERKNRNLKPERLTEQETAVLELLYFLTSFEELVRELDWSETDLRQVLVGMIKKGWVVQFVRRQELPEPLEGLNLDELADSYFVATRQGLLLHNSR